MRSTFDPKKIESKWQERWRRQSSAPTHEQPPAKKFYVLEMFPYPSGTLHVGHARTYSLGDAIARYKMARGYEVLHPMGWDAFGLPAENAAIKHSTHPSKWTYSNIAHMKRQFERLGWTHDWRREIATCTPDYYKWEQVFFVRMFKMGLAYRKTAPTRWCPACETALAREQVRGGECWRCGSKVARREISQWFFKMSEYANELLADCEKLSGWPNSVRSAQREWLKSAQVDWPVSRQRYWGAPIPIVHCGKCGVVPVPESELPVLLPEGVEFQASSTTSPLASSEEFKKVYCPECGGPAQRECETFDTFVGSSWYYLRYCSEPKPEAPFDAADVSFWCPVDVYVGGVEHATMHLLYFRFFHRHLLDSGWIPQEVGREPAKRLVAAGSVLKDGVRMSKSRGNAVDVESVLEKYGSDALRLYLLSDTRPERSLEWREAGVRGSFLFLVRLWRLVHSNLSLIQGIGAATSESPEASSVHTDTKKLGYRVHQTVERATAALEQGYRYNIVIASIRELVHDVRRFNPAMNDVTGREMLKEAFETVVRLLVPITPHIAEELWEVMGHDSREELLSWPESRSDALKLDVVNVVVQVNGRRVTELSISRTVSEQDLVERATKEPGVEAKLGGRPARSVVVRGTPTGRLVNLVTV